MRAPHDCLWGSHRRVRPGQLDARWHASCVSPSVMTFSRLWADRRTGTDRRAGARRRGGPGGGGGRGGGGGERERTPLDYPHSRVSLVLLFFLKKKQTN